MRSGSSPRYTLKCVATYKCKEVQIMAANLAIDDRLIDEARRIGNHKTKKEAVTAALNEYIRWRTAGNTARRWSTLRRSTRAPEV